ncbi:MAG: hypothetical protein IPG00_03775 [Saprospiraceae bacterium]|nr:hypothetical protein [Saprospiraceae bacterium]
MEIKKYIDLGITWAIEAFPGFLLAIAVLVVGIWFIKKMSEVFTGMLSKSGFAPEITSF